MAFRTLKKLRKQPNPQLYKGKSEQTERVKPQQVQAGFRHKAEVLSDHFRIESQERGFMIKKQRRKKSELSGLKSKGIQFSSGKKTESPAFPGKLFLKKRLVTSHKGDNGKVLVVGGSSDYVGAVYLAAEAALRSGADGVTVVAPEKTAWALNCLDPDLITVKVKGTHFTPGSVSKVAEIAETFDVLLVGNGLGIMSGTAKFAEDLCRRVEGLKVIDADAIKAVRLQETVNSVFTPHRKEFEILLLNSGCTEKNFMRFIGNNVILVKGAVDRIFSGKGTAYNRTGHPGMTVGGTGDVLSGIVAGLLAQEKNPWKAAVAAAFVNGTIGQRLAKKYGYGYKASDMLELIGKEVYGLYGR